MVVEGLDVIYRGIVFCYDSEAGEFCIRNDSGEKLLGSGVNISFMRNEGWEPCAPKKEQS